MLGTCIENVRKNVPLVHNITNYVTVNDVANILLCLLYTSGSAFVKNFAAKSGAIVAVTGAIDLVSDGKTCYVIRNGRPEMGKILSLIHISPLLVNSSRSNPLSTIESAIASIFARWS